MSISLMSKVWKLPVSPTKKLILLALADFSDDEGCCYPSLSTLVKKCSISKRAVIYNIKQLIRDGYLKKTDRIHLNGHKRSNLYQLSVDKSVDNSKGGSAPDALGVVHHVHQGSAPDAPSLETPLEPPLRNKKIQQKKREEKIDDDKKLFNAFWKAYPVKKGKGQARKTWEKIIANQPLVDRMKTSLYSQRQEREVLILIGAFVPEWKHPSTWLSGECWKDEQLNVWQIKEKFDIMKRSAGENQKLTHQILILSLQPSKTIPELSDCTQIYFLPGEQIRGLVIRLFKFFATTFNTYWFKQLSSKIDYTKWTIEWQQVLMGYNWGDIRKASELMAADTYASKAYLTPSTFSDFISQQKEETDD